MEIARIFFDRAERTQVPFAAVRTCMLRQAQQPGASLSGFWSTMCRQFMLIAALLLMYSGAMAATGSIGTAQTIRVVMDDSYPPYAFRDNDGVLQGITVDQWRAWQRHTGIAVELSGMEWQDAMRRMRAGEFDVIDTIFRTPEREREFDFTEPYAQLTVPIFFNASLSGITDLKSLQDFAVAAKAGDANIERLRSSGVDNLHLYASYESIVAAARDGKVNVFVVDEPPAQYYLAKYGIADRFRRGAAVNSGQFHRAVRKGAAQLLNTIQGGFASIPGDELQQIDRKWLGTSLPAGWSLRQVVYGLAVAAALIFGLALWTLTLNRVVQRRTAQLRSSEARLRSILEAEPEGVMVVAQDGHLLECNSAGLTMLRAQSLAEAQTKSFADYVVVGQRDTCLQMLTKAIGFGTDHCELEATDLQGKRMWLSLHAARLGMGTQERPVIVLVVHNITERKRNDALMHGQVQVLEQIAAGMPLKDTLAILLRIIEAQATDMCCSILFLDRAANRLRHAAAPSLPAAMTQAIDGLQIGPAAGSCGTAAYRGVNVFVADIAADPLWDNYRQLVLPHGFRACWSTPIFDGSNEVIGTFAIYYRQPGVPSPEHLRLIRIATHFAAVCINRFRTEQALRDSEERFRQVVENIDEVFWIWDISSRQILYASPAFERVFGRSRESLYAAPENLMADVLPEDRAVLDEARSNPSGAFDVEFRIKRPDGSQRWLHARDFPVRDANAAVVRRAGVVRDITEAREFSEHMQQVQKFEAIGVLAGGVAHDFNNILGVISGNAELAHKELDASHPAQYSIEQILKAGERARGLVQQILLFSRSESGPLEVLHLGPLIVEALNFLRATLPANVKLDAALADDVPAVRADATQINQILLNLCTNAWHALSDAGGRISVALDHVVIDSAPTSQQVALTPGDYVCLSICDNGSGMDEATRQRIFEPFFTTKRAGQGTGLGLTIVRSIAQRHGATVVIESALQRGTQVKVYFPRAEQQAVMLAGSIPGILRGAGQRVLCFDDESSLVALMTRMLESQGYRATGYTDPEEGLRDFAAHPGEYDLVVTDYNMPGMTGLEVGRRILAMRQDIPVLLTSGYVTDDLIRAARQVGFRKVLYKPSTIQEFVASVHEAMAASGEYVQYRTA